MLSGDTPPDLKVNVLLVDDTPANLLALEAMLDGLGAQFVQARSGEEALRRLAGDDFAVVVLAMQMPGLDGFETARLIRGRERTRHTPIIFLTADEAGRPTVEQAYALGAVDVLVGPLVPLVLRAKVAGFVELFEARRQADHLQLLIQGTTDYAIFLLDPEGRVATWNTGAERIKGYRAEEIIGQHFSRFYPPEALDRGWPAEELRRAAAEGRFEDEGWRVRQDGSTFWANVVLTALRDEAGRLRGFSKVTRDLTERRQREEELRQLHRDLERRVKERTADLAASNEALRAENVERRRAEERLREESRVAETLHRIGSTLAAELDLEKLVQSVTDEATKITDAAFGAFFYNVADEGGESYALYTISGVPRQAFERFPMPRNTALFEPTFRGRGVVRLADVTQDPRYGQNPPYHGMPEGHLPLRSYLAVSVVSRSGEVLGGLFFGHPRPGVFSERDERIVVGIAAGAAVAIDNARLYQEARRVSEELRRSNEELAAASRHKDEFLAMLAHELRNPLAPVRNALHILKSSRADREVIERARAMMERQVGHMARIVDDLLDVSGLVRGRVQLRPERLDLARLTRDDLEAHRPGLERAGLVLEAELPEVPVWLNGDGTRLTQVLDNLLGNAMKFTPRGGTVAVRLSAEAGGGQAVLSVRDTGAGIDADLLPRLFEPFAQADRSLDRGQGGLGLGLSLVRGLVELHGGTVGVRSEGPGHGAEFVVRLPRQPEPAAITGMPEAPKRASKRLRVLVVEDNRDSADSLKMLLELFGYEVAVAYTGPSGVEVAKGWRPDVVLCDIGLPGMNGFDVARTLREDPATAKARMIAVTGYGSDEDRLKTRQAGFDAHLTKPADPTQIQELLAGSGSLN